MLKISPSVMHALSKSIEDRFVARLGTFVPAEIGVQLAEPALRQLIVLGRARGLVSERELATYVSIVAVFSGPSGQEPAWVAQCLDRAPPSERMAALRSRAETMAAALPFGYAP